ncbi:putative effector protein [Aphelenchoides bicaudatus]|nr:putative effector protein [Aphelenchoides bicaudatus]
MWMRVFVSLALILLTVHGAAVKKEPTKVPTDQKPKEPDNTEEVDFSGEWECGGEDFSKLISQQMIEKDCPKLLHPVNDCCLGHDQCYTDQKGQKHCDEVFCNCLDKATYSPKNVNNTCYEEHSKYFCDMVKEFGDSFYAASAHPTNEGSGEEPKNEQHPRIYESRTHKSQRAIRTLPNLEAFN